MKELLEELITAIQSLQQRDIWDYVAIIAPLILSVIAVWISISTSKKQNKIALFEMRFKVVSILNFLLPVARELVNSKEIDDWTILAVAMDTYKMSATDSSAGADYLKVESFYTHLILEAGKVNCLFDEKGTKQIMVFLEEFHEFVSLVNKDEVVEEVRSNLNKTISLLEKSKVMNKIDSSLKI